MSHILWHVAETLLIMYTIISYAAVSYSLFIVGGEKAAEIPLVTRLLFASLAPFVLILALFIPLPEKGK